MSGKMDVASLRAIDVHVHLEHTGKAAGADVAAEKYFGTSGAPRERNALADYYRSRQMAFVIFTVDERLTGRPMVPNDEVISSRMTTPMSRFRSPASTRRAVPKRCGGAPSDR